MNRGFAVQEKLTLRFIICRVSVGRSVGWEMSEFAGVVLVANLEQA